MTDVEDELSRNLLHIRLVWLSVMTFCTGLTGRGQHSACYKMLTGGNCVSVHTSLTFTQSYHIIMPPPRRGAGALSGDRRPSSVCPSVCLSVCLMSRTSALTRKPKGLGRRNFAQGYPRSHATPTPTSRSKVKSQGGAGAYCGGDLAAQLVYFLLSSVLWLMKYQFMLAAQFFLNFCLQ